jgi:FtsH-binding integral membrane protein
VIFDSGDQEHAALSPFHESLYCRGESIMANQHIQQGSQAAGESAVTIVAGGIRAYLLRVYNYMAAGLALTGAVAYYGAASGFYASIAGTPAVMGRRVCPVGACVVPGFSNRAHQSRCGTDQLWAYAGLAGLSLCATFLVYTRVRASRVCSSSARARSQRLVFTVTPHGRPLTVWLVPVHGGS